MPITKTTVTGPILDATGTAYTNAAVVFTPSTYIGDDPADTVIGQTPVEVVPDPTTGAFSIELAPSETVSYTVSLVVKLPCSSKTYRIGLIYVPASGPVALEDLLPVFSPNVPTNAELLAALSAAVASAEASAAAAISAQDSAAAAAASAAGYFLPYVLASEYGFDVGNTAAENAAAMELAIAAAATGKRIYVFAETDFECGNFNVRDQHFDIEFLGQGKWVDGGQMFTAINEFTDVQDITSITLKSITQDGSPVVVTEFAVADASAYSPADVVKIVADDLDPFNGKADRRIGQWHTVASVSGNLIRVQGELAHDFATNPRIGILPKYRTRIWGLKVKSNAANTSSLMSISGIYHGMFNIEVEGEHGQIAINHNGYRSKFIDCVFGRMKADSTGSLGYGINDVSSFETLILRPVGYNARHIVTTNHNSVDVGGNLRTYGRSFGHTVKDGVAYGCQGTPWDDHDGSMNSKWINCKAYGGVNNSSAYTAAFQLRGVNSQVIDCECDNTYEAFVRATSIAMGDCRVVNGYSRADLGLRVDSTPDDTTITWLGGVIETRNEESSIYLNGGKTTISGGAIIRNMDVTRGSASVIMMEDAVLHLGDVGLEMLANAVGPADNFTQIIRCLGTSNRLTGSFNLRHENIATFEAIIDDDSTTSMFADIDVTIQSGGVIPGLFSSAGLTECTGRVIVMDDLSSSYEYNPLFSGSGADGDSAYQVAVANGFVGTEAEWLASLVGADGVDGVDAAAFIDSFADLATALASGQQIDGRGDTFVVTAPLTFAAGTGVTNATFDVTGVTTTADQACLTATGGGLGSPLTVSANIAEGATGTTVSSTATLSAGDTIQISSTADWSVSDSVPLSEEVVIESVDSGTALTFDRKTRFAYATADTAVIKKVTRVDAGYWSHVKIIGNGTQANGIDFEFVKNLRTGPMTFEGILSRNFVLTSAADFDTGPLQVAGSGASSLNYGVLYRDGCQRGNIGPVNGSDIRHHSTGGGTGGINVGVHTQRFHAVRPRAAPLDQHAGCLNCTSDGFTMEAPAFDAGEDGLVLQGANATVRGVDVDMGSTGRHSANIQSLVDYPGEWFCDFEGTFQNAVNTGVFIKPEGSANVSSIRGKVRVRGCADEAVEVYLQDCDLGFLDLDVDIDIEGSATKQNIIVRQYTTFKFGAGRIVGRSKRANDTEENIQLQGVSTNTIANFTIAAVLENGSHGVRGVDATTGTINTAGNVYVGTTINEAGL